MSSCGKAASKCCGSCGFVPYCSVECQKEDWKKHHKKNECVSMKKLASVPLTEQEIHEVAIKISRISERLEGTGESKRSINMNKECLDFVRDRLSRLEDDSLIRIGVRLITICMVLINLGQVYFYMARSSESDHHCISYTSEARELLVQMKDAGITQPNLWLLLMRCDSNLYHLYVKRGQPEKAKYHAVEYVATARDNKGPDQVEHLIKSLGMLSCSLRVESMLPESLAVAEESYIIASKHYSPAHKMVLDAGGEMIDCLIAMKDFDTADTYCRINYANVIDPMNAGDYEDKHGAKIMWQWINIWLWKEPDEDEIVAKAQADEVRDISIKLCAVKSRYIHLGIGQLSKICEVLLTVNELTEETEGILHQLITMCITENNLDGSDIHDSFLALAEFYSKLNESLPMEKKSNLLQENIELCRKKFLEDGSCYDSSVGYVKGSQEIIPYFKGNVELHI